MRFELKGLDSYDEASMLVEIQRVASLLPDQQLTRAKFETMARISSSTVVKRLGGWAAALERAGLANRYSGRAVSEKMRHQAARRMTDEELLDELRRVAKLLNSETLASTAFDEHSPAGYSSVLRRFKSWKRALALAGLRPPPLGRRHTDDEYFENLLKVWTHYGRQPFYSDMNAPPSEITAGAYEKKWGTWRNALKAFVERVNLPLDDPAEDGPAPIVAPTRSGMSVSELPSHSRKLALGVRYRVLSRDRFRCVLCGGTPATDPFCLLHVDHIVPVAHGGANDLMNLRTLCEHCNLGRGAHHA